MHNLLATKNNYTLLKPIPNEYIKSCLNHQTMKITTYSKDQVIHFEGDISTNAELILSGQVVVERIDESGNLMTITSLLTDDILGGNLVFSKNPYYPMTVTAKIDTTLLVIQKELLFNLCSNNSTFLRHYLEYISDHTLLLGDKIKHYVNRTIRESIIAYLKNEYKLHNSNTILLSSSKKALAERIGVQRTSLSRELQKMKNEGLIEYDATSITILNRNYL
ncbi:MAG: Crp/Fnr family transcriptional regulator [Firmicutes bacterium HGW-Firmicutes-3]|jgi:CRP-like cAMP-binding protein|nr:MAG: Crp/Fnr family transcriptional regulator [Firmicutes bacterium HGW-Firmicutes-3]